MEEDNFNEYILYFKSLSLKEKREIVYDRMKMLAAFSNNMCKSLDIKNEILVNSELVNINDGECTIDDYLEAMIVLISSTQESLCDFNIGLDEITTKLYINSTEN